MAADFTWEEDGRVIWYTQYANGQWWYANGQWWTWNDELFLGLVHGF